jgi:hypothetical protein
VILAPDGRSVDGPATERQRRALGAARRERVPA